MARTVKCDLSAAIGGHHGYIAWRKQVVCMPGQALREYGGMLANPKFIGRIGGTCCSEILHRLVGGQVWHEAKVLDHSTTFTKG